MKRLFHLLFLIAVAASAQNPQTQTAPLYQANAKWTNGVAPGYAPFPGTGLHVTIGPGTANCAGTIETYAGGSLTLTASTTNYVYLNTASSCAPAVKTSAFGASDIPLAVIVASGSGITSIVDDRTPFTFVNTSGGGGVSTGIVPELPYYSTTTGVAGNPDLWDFNQSNLTLNSSGYAANTIVEDQYNRVTVTLNSTTGIASPLTNTCVSLSGSISPPYDRFGGGTAGGCFQILSVSGTSVVFYDSTGRDDAGSLPPASITSNLIFRVINSPTGPIYTANDLLHSGLNETHFVNNGNFNFTANGASDEANHTPDVNNFTVTLQGGDNGTNVENVTFNMPNLPEYSGRVDNMQNFQIFTTQQLDFGKSNNFVYMNNTKTATADDQGGMFFVLGDKFSADVADIPWGGDSNSFHLYSYPDQGAAANFDVILSQDNFSSQTDYAGNAANVNFDQSWWSNSSGGSGTSNFNVTGTTYTYQSLAGASSTFSVQETSSAVPAGRGDPEGGGNILFSADCIESDSSPCPSPDGSFQVTTTGPTIITSTNVSLTTDGALELQSFIQMPQVTPSDTQTCTAGTIWTDANYIYVCTATNTVKRAALSTF